MAARHKQVASTRSAALHRACEHFVMSREWLGRVLAATVAVVDDRRTNAEDLLRHLGRVERVGALTFDEAMDLQGSLYEDGTSESRAVFQLHGVTGRDGPWWALVEPNGYRLSLNENLLALAGASEAVSVFWNADADNRVLRVKDGRILSVFDPVIDADRLPADGRDLPFDTDPRAAALALLERWTSVAVGQVWFTTAVITFVVETATPRRSTLSESVMPAAAAAKAQTGARVPLRDPAAFLAPPPRSRPGVPTQWRVTLQDDRTVDVWAHRFARAGDDWVFLVAATVPADGPDEALVTVGAPVDPGQLQVVIARFPISAVKGLGKPWIRETSSTRRRVDRPPALTAPIASSVLPSCETPVTLDRRRPTGNSCGRCPSAGSGSAADSARLRCIVRKAWPSRPPSRATPRRPSLSQFAGRR